MNQSRLPYHRHLRHPRTGDRLQAVGFRKDGRAIWPVIGASPDDDPSESDAAAKAAADKAAADKATADKAAADKAAADKAGTDDWAKTFEGMTPAEVKEAVENSRKWEGRAKGNKTKADQLDALVKALTGDEEGEKDPEKLTAHLNSAQGENRSLKVENAVLRGAAKHGADPALLSDSRSFMAEVDKLDPTSDSFQTDLEAAVKKAVTDNPSFALNAATDTGNGRRPKPVRQQGNTSEGNQQGTASSGAQRYQERHKRASA